MGTPRVFAGGAGPASGPPPARSSSNGSFGQYVAAFSPMHVPAGPGDALASRGHAAAYAPPSWPMRHDMSGLDLEGYYSSQVATSTSMAWPTSSSSQAMTSSPSHSSLLSMHPAPSDGAYGLPWDFPSSAGAAGSPHSAYNGPASKTRVCRYYLSRNNNHFGKTCSYVHPCRNVVIEGACKHGKRCTDDHICRDDLYTSRCAAGPGCPLIHITNEADRAALLEMYADWMHVKPDAAAVGPEALMRMPCPFWFVDTLSGCKAGPECIYEHAGQFQMASRPLPTPTQVRFAERAWERRRLASMMPRLQPPAAARSAVAPTPHGAPTRPPLSAAAAVWSPPAMPFHASSAAYARDEAAAAAAMAREMTTSTAYSMRLPSMYAQPRDTRPVPPTASVHDHMAAWAEAVCAPPSLTSPSRVVAAGSSDTLSTMASSPRAAAGSDGSGWAHLSAPTSVAVAPVDAVADAEADDVWLQGVAALRL